MSILKKLSHLEKEAEEFGFKWENPKQILDQIKSECAEIEEHLDQIEDRQKLQEEIGDLIHAAFSLCVFSRFDPKETLDKTVNKFENRFNKVKFLSEKAGLKNLQGLSFDELMHFWKKAKEMESREST